MLRNAVRVFQTAVLERAFATLKRARRKRRANSGCALDRLAAGVTARTVRAHLADRVLSAHLVLAIGVPRAPFARYAQAIDARQPIRAVHGRGVAVLALAISALPTALTGFTASAMRTVFVVLRLRTAKAGSTIRSISAGFARRAGGANAVHGSWTMPAVAVGIFRARLP